MPDTYVLVHGAWHTGALLEETARHIRAVGNRCECPTLAGNRPDDDCARTALDDAAQSVVTFIEERNLEHIRLVGHSYGGMVISKVVDLVPHRVKRLVYWNAFVPRNGECLIELSVTL